MDAASVVLRPAARGDAAAIQRMVRGAHLNPFGLDWHRFHLAVTRAGERVGCVQIKRHGDGTRELASLVVAVDWRGAGLAARLIERAREGQPPPLYLMCVSSLEPFYNRFGFSAMGREALPPYYRRILRVFGFYKKVTRSADSLSVMRWE